MKKIILLFSLLLVSICFAACKNNDVYLSDIESSIPDTSSGFEIIITNDSSTATVTDSSVASTEPTQSELEQIASDWENIEVEIEVVNPSSKTEITTSDTSTSSKKASSNTTTTTPSSSSSLAPQGSEGNETEDESSSSEEPTSSKVTSLPDYYEGRY